MHCPTNVHQQAVKQILRYLHGTISHGICIVVVSNLSLTCYTTSDWASCTNDRRSSSGYYTLFGSSLLTWSSSKQKVVSCSSTKSEYRELANAPVELTRVESLLHELQISFSPPPLLFCDNISATYLVANPILHSRTKHVEIDYHFIHSNGSLDVHFIPYESQFADIMTKSLPTQRFLALCSKLTVLSRPVILREDVRTNNILPSGGQLLSRDQLQDDTYTNTINIIQIL